MPEESKAGSPETTAVQRWRIVVQPLTEQLDLWPNSYLLKKKKKKVLIKKVSSDYVSIKCVYYRKICHII